jgi:hypothetical protein
MIAFSASLHFRQAVVLSPTKSSKAISILCFPHFSQYPNLWRILRVTGLPMVDFNTWIVVVVSTGSSSYPDFFTPNGCVILFDLRLYHLVLMFFHISVLRGKIRFYKEFIDSNIEDG